MAGDVVWLVRRGPIGLSERVLLDLLEMNRREGVSLMLCYRDGAGRDDIAFTGIYRDRPAEALNTLTVMTCRLAQAQAAQYG